MVHRLADDLVDVADEADAVRAPKFLARRARAHHRREVAAGETDDAIGLEPRFLKEPRQRHAARVGRDKRLRVGTRLEDIRVMPVVGRRREDERGRRELRIAGKRLLQFVERTAADGIVDRQVAHHIRIEAGDARIDERQLAPVRSDHVLAEVIGAALVANPLRLT